MMDLAQEKRRLQEQDAYGVKTTRGWNAYHREWDRQHPRAAAVRKILWRVFLPVLVIIAWAPVWLPVAYWLKGN